MQSQRLQNLFTIMEGAFKNIVDWIHSNLHTDLPKYMTESQVYISNNILQVMNDLMKQEVKPHNTHYYIIHHELILLDIFTKKYKYNNDIYASYADLKIEKTPETNPKKLKSNINKPDIDLEKIDFNIDVKANEIDDKNKKKAVHPSGDLIDNNDSNIGDYGAQHERTNQNNRCYTLVENKLQQSP